MKSIKSFFVLGIVLAFFLFVGCSIPAADENIEKEFESLDAGGTSDTPKANNGSGTYNNESDIHFLELNESDLYSAWVRTVDYNLNGRNKLVAVTYEFLPDGTFEIVVKADVNSLKQAYPSLRSNNNLKSSEIYYRLSGKYFLNNNIIAVEFDDNVALFENVIVYYNFYYALDNTGKRSVVMNTNCPYAEFINVIDVFASKIDEIEDSYRLALLDNNTLCVVKDGKVDFELYRR